MVDDNQKNDEYHFADLDGLGIEPDMSLDSAFEGESESGEQKAEGMSSPPGRGRFDALSPEAINIIRKGAIAVGALVLVVVFYKSVSSLFASKASKTEIAPVASKATKVTQPTSTSPSLVQRVNEAERTASVPGDVNEKLSSLKQEQSRIENDLSNVHKQLATVTQAVSDMTAKMEDIKQTMLVLSERMEQQSNQLARVQTMARSRKTTSSTLSEHKQVTPVRPTYSIQAIIPGRAWLMSKEGRTLTVSKGSSVPGYGVVRVINPQLGRVYTSSGRVIRFSKADS